MIPQLLDHLWQSSFVLGGIGLATLAFRNNGAQVRHALWTAASLKFLLPFVMLNGLGLLLARLLGLKAASSSMIETLYAAGQPFSGAPAFAALPVTGSYLLPVTLAWGAGMVAVAGFWLSRWQMLRITLRAARDAGIAAPMPVKISAAQLEPGLVGIVRPVLLLPEGILEKFGQAELQAIIAHEACHLRRRDNPLAVLHMLVQALFWFWPPVWWLGTRLIAEREQACDEAVLAAGNDPETYASSILKVCKFYMSSPLACAAGIAGANLKQRMETIMENRLIVHVTGMKKALLATSAAALVVLPVAAGLLWAPAAGAQGAACKLAPVMGTHTLPPYPMDSVHAHETGAVLLHVTIARDGHATGAKVTHGSGIARLDDAAAKHVEQNYRWQPLNCSSAQTDVRVVFALADRPEGHAAPAKR